MLGQGTASNPYLISNEEDLNKIRENTQASYRLTNDIYMTSYQLGEGWLPIEEFYGTIDGGNYTIHDLYINRPNESVGFIKHLEYRLQVGGGKISNLHFKNVNIVGGANTGVIAGTAKGYTDVLVDHYGNNRSASLPVEITGCTLEGTIRSASNNLGGLIGATLAEMRPSAWNDNELVNALIRSSHADLNIHAFGSNIGGLVGDATSGSVTISTSSSRGEITNGYDNVGGLVGTLVAGRGGINNSYSLMHIQGANYVGGMIGEIKSGHVQSYRLTNSYFAGTFDAPNRSTTQIGAVTGYWRGIVNGDPDIRMIYDESKAQLEGPKYNLSSVKNGRTVPLSTSDIQDVRTFVDRGFDIIDTWYASQDSKGNYLRLKNEFNEDLFTMLGDGTEGNPYQIDSVDKLISLTSYDRQNWKEYNNTLLDENDFHSANYKPDMNFSSPNRYHYKLTNDIDLDVYPWNEIGWYPLTKVRETSTIERLPSEYIGDTLWDRVWIEANNTFKTYNSLGELTGYTDGVKTLGEGNKWENGVGGLNNKHIKGFMGILNGNDFSINGLTIKEWRGLTRLGLFDVISGGTVENLRLKGINIDIDYHRGEYSGTRPTGGVLSNIIQAGSNINKVSVEGLSTIKDYRADVGGASFDISGFIHSGRRLDRTAGSELRRAIIKNTSVSIKNTFTNVDTSDTYMTHFTPFMNLVQYVRIEDSYSASSYRALSPQGQELSGVHGDRVFARNITGTGIILRSYYDSEIVNSTTGSNEDPIEGKVEINGRNTEAMKLQSTYTGWDFDRVWDISGFDYPEFKPYDESYVPPVYKTEYLVKTQVDALYMSVVRDFVKKNMETITLRSVARKFTSKTKMEKSGSTGVTTQIDELYSVAFAYENPVIEEREVTTGIEELESELDYDFKVDRQHIVLTSIDELYSSTTTSTISKGAFYNGISIEAIRNNSVVIKINDRGIKSIEYGESVTSTDGVDFITLHLDNSDFDIGDNTVTIRGLGSEGEELINRKLSVRKESIDSQLNRSLLINGQYYEVIEEDNGLLTLDRDISKSLFARNPNGYYNIVESFDYTLTPELNGENPVHVNSRYDNGFIRDEYELDTETSRVETKIHMKSIRKIHKENGTIDFSDRELIDGGYITILEAQSQKPRMSVGTEPTPERRGSEISDEMYGLLSELDGEGGWSHVERRGGVLYENLEYSIEQRFVVDVVGYIEDILEFEIPANTVSEKVDWLYDEGFNLDFDWYGDFTGENTSDYIRYRKSFIVMGNSGRVVQSSLGLIPENDYDGYHDSLRLNENNGRVINSKGEFEYIVHVEDRVPRGETGLATDWVYFRLELLNAPIVVSASDGIHEIGQTYIPKEKNRGEF